jgi:hypothetical protein
MNERFPVGVVHRRAIDGRRRTAAQQQALDRTAARHASTEKPRREDARVVDHEQVAWRQDLGQVGKPAVRERTGRRDPGATAATSFGLRAAPARSGRAADRNRSRGRPWRGNVSPSPFAVWPSTAELVPGAGDGLATAEACPRTT